MGVVPDEIVLACPHTVLKTSSGKIRRAATQELFRRNALGRSTRKVWWQLVRVGWFSILPAVRRVRRRGGELLYASYVWTLFGLLAPLAWCTTMLLPSMSWRWVAIRGIAKVLRFASGTRFIVDGLQHLPSDRPFILVSNHASYLDALVLTAAIPRTLSFVAKRELLDHVAVRVMLRRLGTLFVERFDFQRSVEELERVIQAARDGRSLVFFPEGTFDRVSGTLGFRLGAFVAAAQLGLPVVPVALRGTRSMLRPGTWFPRFGPIHVVISAPIEPEGEKWNDAIQLRDAARQTILPYTGEPDRATESPVD
jgi:1-acyl-sn-glycerol-3-phosphate acyltransferase